MEPLTTSIGDGIAQLGSAIIAVGIVLAVMWRLNSKDKNRQDILRMLLEKGHDVQDPEVLRLLKSSPRPLESKPGDAYKAFQIGGLITIAIAIGIAVMFLFLAHTTNKPEALVFVGLGIGALLLIIGLALLACTRFVSKPVNQPDQDR